jgi:hypothetical protein
MSKCYVYAWRNINNGKMNIGYKSPNGEEHTYITSLKNTEFWKDYSYGLLKRSILFVGEESEANIAKSVEWFALKYAVATAKDRLYNPGNNGSKGDENLIPKATKQLVIDYIEGYTDAMPLIKKDEDADFAQNLSDRIKNKEFEIHQIPRVEIEKYSRNQVRTKDKVINHIRNIRTKIMENPERSRELYGPIVVVVKASGEKMIVDGNSRFAATEGLVGWDVLPVIFINESEFGETEVQREDNYDLVGLYENKASEEIKEENSWADLKRNIVNYLVRHNLDFSKKYHIDRAREIIYARFLCVCESKQQLNGILKSIISDYEKSQAELKYEQNIISYDDSFIERYKWNKYYSKDVACVVAKASEAKFMKAIGYIQHAMFNDRLSKGAIVFHFSNKSELVVEEKEKWIEKLKKVVKYHGLPITVEILPAFEN